MSNSKTVHEYYVECCTFANDINEHLPTLKKYSEYCDHVTEMGVRTVVSTFSLILGNPSRMISIDIRHPCDFNSCDRLNSVKQYAQQNNINYDFLLGNTLDLTIEKTDLLFIDTLHTYDQLISELKLHSDNVNKFIILHDTTTYSFTDEKLHGYIPSKTNKQGLWSAVEDFLLFSDKWNIKEKFVNNNGLTILERKHK